MYPRPDGQRVQTLLRFRKRIKFGKILFRNLTNEKDLESAILTHLQEFLLELGNGFSFSFENPTIGILLCTDKNNAVVKFTLPKDSNIVASQYQLYLPTEQELLAEVNKELERY